MTYDFDSLSAIFAQIPFDGREKMIEAIQAHKRIFLYGAGRSGLMIKAFAMRLAQAGYTVFAVGEVTTPAIAEGDLLILASASGETASVLRYAETAKAMNATVLALTATADGALAQTADVVIHLSAPTKNEPQKGSIMGTLFEQSVLLFGDAVIEALGANTEKMRARHANLE